MVDSENFRPTPIVTSRSLVARAVPAGWVESGTRWLDGVSGLAGCERVYRGTQAILEREPGRGFAEAALEVLEITTRVSRSDLERVPVKGPLVVAANHPFGGVEGLVLAAMVKRVRGDVKLLVNEMLGVLPEFRPELIGVDVFGGEGARRRNSEAMREALKHLQGGGCVIVFPAGEVSHFRLRDMNVTDPDWQRGVGLLVRRSGAAVLPVYVPGGNGVVFNAAGFVHPRLRTLLLPKSLLWRRGTTMEVRVGAVVSAKRLGELSGAEGDDAQMMRYLRRRVYMLRHRGEVAAAAVGESVAGEAIIGETPAADLERDIGGLPEEALLVGNGDYRAYLARPRQIPHVLREIGRLREVTFRAVGEGTGKSFDLDDYDQHYLHLFVWHAKDRRLVGAYRLGRADLILRAKGRKGLYTSTLFKFSPRVLEKLADGGVEMGRSFVRAEYQRSHQPLLMLWKGIGTFVSREKRYHTLFGPVSISASYATVSRELMVRFLSMSGLRSDDAADVRARSPFKRRNYEGVDEAAVRSLVRDHDDMSELIADVEPDAKGIPVLLAQYLRLGARVLSFNVDHEFGGCLDALVTVDLRKTDRKLLKRYLGEEGMAEFLKTHRVGVASLGVKG
jgi:putative hemolysin